MSRPAEQVNCNLLLTGGSVVTMDEKRRVIDPGAVAVTADRIAAVGTPAALAQYHPERTIDCTGKVVIPGLIDCHTHFFEALGRGMGEGMSLFDWLRNFVWPYAMKISPRDAAAAARLAGIEAIRAGTTCVLDNHYAPSDFETTVAVAKAVHEVGLRGIIARGVVGPPTDVARSQGLPATFFRYSAEEELEITRACIVECPPDAGVRVWPAPLTVAAVDRGLTRDCVALAHEMGTGWHAHCSEVAEESDTFMNAYGVRPVDWLYEEGLLDRHATLAHLIWLSDQEVQRAGECRVGVAYNPISNQYLGSGTMRLRELRLAGAVVGLGTDGPICGHRQDMFEVIKQAILVQRMHHLDAEASSCGEALELATREGARVCLVDAGVLSPGKLADMTVVGLDRPHLRPLNRTIGALAYAARGSDVDSTIIGGRVVFENGSCTLVDEDEIMREAQCAADDLVRRAGLETFRSEWHRSARCGID